MRSIEEAENAIQLASKMSIRNSGHGQSSKTAQNKSKRLQPIYNSVICIPNISFGWDPHTRVRWQCFWWLFHRLEQRRSEKQFPSLTHHVTNYTPSILSDHRQEGWRCAFAFMNGYTLYSFSTTNYLQLSRIYGWKSISIVSQPQTHPPFRCMSFIFYLTARGLFIGSL